MKVLVIGSGLIGLTTAYFLRQRGHEVTVLDRQPGLGLETSFANGALLTPSMSDPWNAPGCWRVLLSSLGKPDAAMQLRIKALPSLIGWGIGFLKNSRRTVFERSTSANLRLGLYSLQVMHALREQTGIQYAEARGSLRFFRNRDALDRAYDAAVRTLSPSLRVRRLSVTETIEVEPALTPIADRLAGAIFYEVDELGDAYKFCAALAARMRADGVEFRFGAEVTSWDMTSGKVTAAVVGNDRVSADRYVVAAGSYSAPLLSKIGIDVPVRPAKGYSITFEDSRDKPSLSIPLVDDLLHAAIVPLEGVLRIVGTAEFAGFDRTTRSDRIRNLQKLLIEVLPQANIDRASAKPWCGLRPMSMDGMPIIGPTSISNVFINTGHGHLGWTMAAGSGRMLADLMCGDAPAIDAAPFNLARF